MSRGSGTKPGKLYGQAIKHHLFQPAPEEEAFLIAIENDPTDLQPRLAYAEWLNQRGDIREQYVRVSAEFERLEQSPDRGRIELHRLWMKKYLLAKEFDASWVILLEGNLALPTFLSPRGQAAGKLIRDVMLKSRQVCTASSEVFISPLRCEIHPNEFVKPGKPLIVVSHAEPEVAAFFSKRYRKLFATMAIALAEIDLWAEPFSGWASLVMGQTTIGVNRVINIDRV
jgi:uncharacterized protein (TIGR02996 family)